ncbi:hypothetical protein KEJ21_04605 [Candidatus Bathyarchaeota archaeon]|nr:hypothetical protein [Candidatus Bathyarchaeota archaeon]
MKIEAFEVKAEKFRFAKDKKLNKLKEKILSTPSEDMAVNLVSEFCLLKD